MNLAEYKSIIFDCDGVVLDSNKIKTQAFYNVASTYGSNVATELVQFHVKNGGVSRYKKFEYFFKNILNKTNYDVELESLVNAYADNVYSALLNSNVTPGLEQLRESTRSSRWFIVSGGDQDELRRVFKHKKLYEYFDGGIYGSPDSKEEILERQLDEGNVLKPALFLGDSKYDHIAASKYDIDFVFVYEWTEYKQWKEYREAHDFQSIQNVAHLTEIK